MWLSHASFISLVNNNWAIPCSGTPRYLAQKLKILKSKLKIWNYEVFGQLKHYIADAKKLVVEAQTLYDSNPSKPPLLALNSSKSSLHNWLKAESVYWKQKSKIRWLKDGDRNTEFFHLSAITRSMIAGPDEAVFYVKRSSSQHQMAFRVCASLIATLVPK